MKRNLLIIGSLIMTASVVFAQQKAKKNPYLGTGYSGKNLSVDGTAFLFPEKAAPQQAETDYKQIGAPLPKFVIINKESQDISEKVINAGNLFVIVFNPTCEHCEDETRMLVKNLFLFKKSKVLMVAAPIQTGQLSYFDAVVNFSQYPGTFTVSVDSADILHKLFNYTTLPQINIYDGKEHRLLQTFNGDTPLDSLKQYIE